MSYHADSLGDTLTLLRRSKVTTDQKWARYGDAAPAITHVAGDVLDRQALRRAAAGAESILACFHAPYDARIWQTVLPPRGQAVVDCAEARGFPGLARGWWSAARGGAARRGGDAPQPHGGGAVAGASASRGVGAAGPRRERAARARGGSAGIPVVFPESMYAFLGGAARLAEGARPTPGDPKGRIRTELMEARRRHPATTVSVVASDVVGPTSRGTGTAVATALVIEPLLAGRPVVVLADPDAPHSLTHLPDLAQAMVYCARTATTLTAEAPGRSVVLHAPTDTAHSMRALAARTAEHAGVRERRVIAVPRRLTALLGRVNTLMRELSGIADLWYGPCVLEPGVLTTVHGLQATPWAEAIASTIAPPPRAAHGSAAAEPRDARG